jgi:hypothetical protein
LEIRLYIYGFLPAFGELPTYFKCVVDITNSILDVSGWAGRLDLILADDVAQNLCQYVLCSNLLIKSGIDQFYLNIDQFCILVRNTKKKSKRQNNFLANETKLFAHHESGVTMSDTELVGYIEK